MDERGASKFNQLNFDTSRTCINSCILRVLVSTQSCSHVACVHASISICALYDAAVAALLRLVLFTARAAVWQRQHAVLLLILRKICQCAAVHCMAVSTTLLHTLLLHTVCSLAPVKHPTATNHCFVVFMCVLFNHAQVIDDTTVCVAFLGGWVGGRL
jgi:hypothetical protein